MDDTPSPDDPTTAVVELPTPEPQPAPQSQDELAERIGAIIRAAAATALAVPFYATAWFAGAVVGLAVRGALDGWGEGVNITNADDE